MSQFQNPSGAILDKKVLIHKKEMKIERFMMITIYSILNHKDIT